MASKTLHGGRVVLYIDSGGGNLAPIGVFSEFDYTVDYITAEVEILGRFDTVEIAEVGMKPVFVTCTGFRASNGSPYKIAAVPTLKKLIENNSIVLNLVDRATGTTILTVKDAHPFKYRSTAKAKNLQTLIVEFVGLGITDEGNTDDADSGGLKTVPPPTLP